MFTVVITNNTVFWDIASCGSSKNRRFEGTYRLTHEGDKNLRARNKGSSNYKPKHHDDGDYVPPKRRLLQEPHCVTYQKTALLALFHVSVTSALIGVGQLHVPAALTSGYCPGTH
jgi:hypothetical protein